MPEYKLSYFPMRGRAEPIRYIFHQAGVAFEDNRFSRDQWFDLKPGFAFGQVPALEVDGRQLAQSMTIARYLANEFNLTGKSTWERALADMYVDGVTDLSSRALPLAMSIMGGDQEKTKTAFEEFRDGAYKDFREKYETFLSSAGTGFFVGNALTWADLIVAELNDRFLGHDSDVLKDYPHLKKHHEMVHNLPNIKKYLETRPITPL